MKLYNLYFVAQRYMQILCILNKTVETLDKTKSTAFISCVDTHTFSQPFTFSLLVNKQTLEKKLRVTILPFPSMS